MKMSEFTTKLQTLCHEGYSDCEICIKVFDGFYKVDDVNKMVVKSEDEERTHFIINTKL